MRTSETTHTVTKASAPGGRRRRASCLSYFFAPFAILRFFAPFVLLLSAISPLYAAEPTLARLSLQAPPEQMADLEKAYVAKLVPILKRHGLTESAQRGRANTDGARVRQMLINLLSNAIKFTDSGNVTVQARCENTQLVIAVTDTGKGIPPDEIDTIFDEYRQVKGSDRAHRGTGLGLSITRKFSELLGGSISVQSEIGKGSTFSVRIPMVF